MFVIKSVFDLNNRRSCKVSVVVFAAEYYKREVNMQSQPRKTTQLEKNLPLIYPDIDTVEFHQPSKINIEPTQISKICRNASPMKFRFRKEVRLKQNKGEISSHHNFPLSSELRFFSRSSERRAQSSSFSL